MDTKTNVPRVCLIEIHIVNVSLEQSLFQTYSSIRDTPVTRELNIFNDQLLYSSETIIKHFRKVNNDLKTWGGGQNLERPKCRTADISEFRNLEY